jgi:type I restriction enzyme S subunit
MDAFAGAIGISDSDGKASPVVHCYRSRPNVDPRFFANLLRDAARSEFIASLAKGIRERSTAFDAETFRTLVLPVPNLATQRAIADFLDAETARIDSLVAKKRRLRRLLGTRLATLARKLIFTRTNAKKIRIGRVVSILPGFAFASSDFLDDEQDGIRLLRGINVAPGSCRWGEVVYLPESQVHKHKAYSLSVGDLVLGMDRPFISDGTRLATIKETDVPALLVQRVARIRTKESMNTTYLSFALHSDVFRDHCTPIATGVSVPHISSDQIADFRVPLPDQKAQERIAAQLVDEEIRINTLRDRIARQVDLLAEHRQALIAAAVTGQLKVPGAPT